MLAAAIASRTEQIQIHLAALIAPLHDPVRLAEDLAVLSLISNGRVVPVISAGYREEEFEAIGKSLKDRKHYMDMIIPFLRQAFTGEAFEYEGRTIQVTPKPDVVPMLVMGGSSRPAALRAARQADYFIPSVPDIWDIYRDELQRLGKPDMGPAARQPATVYFVAEDPDAYWQQLAPHAMHEQNSYAEWAEQSGIASPYSYYRNSDDLRDSGKYTVMTAQEMVALITRMDDAEPLILSPLVGGLHPDLAWQNLQLFEREVFPHIGASNDGVFR